MNTLERTTGNPFTRDPDYAAFTGRLVHVSSYTYYDPKAKAWIKRTVEYIDVGRSAEIEPVDVEAQLEPEPWEESYQVRAMKHKRIQRLAKWRMEITAYLREHGPSHLEMIAADLGYSLRGLRFFIRDDDEQTFCKVGNYRRAVLWGLVGIHDKEAA